MTEAAPSAGRRPRAAAIAAVAGVWLVVDQITKSIALRTLDDGPVDLFWTLRFRLTFNSGASFSMGQGYGGLIGLVGVFALLYLLRSVSRWPGRLVPLATGMVVGGAIGNMVDRAVRSGRGGFLGGSVVDFIDFQWFPVFNVADIGVVCGAVLLVVASLLAPPDGAAPAVDGEAAGDRVAGEDPRR